MSSVRGRRATAGMKGHRYTQLLAVNDHTCDGLDQDAAENITVHHDAILKSIQFSGTMTVAANNDYFVAELSDSGNFQAYQNDNGNTILLLGSRFSVLTDGATNMFVETIKDDINIPFIAGDRIFLNIQGTNAKNLDLHAIFFWEAK